MRHGIVLALLCLPLLTVAIPAQSTEQARMWDIVRSPSWDLTVRSVERTNEPLQATATIAVFRIDLTNRTTGTLTPRADDFVLLSSNGGRSSNRADTAEARTFMVETGVTRFGDAVPPGVSITTLLLFDIDRHAGRLTLAFLPARETIRIDECKCNLPSPVRTNEGV
jgi:hypothetical protein